MKMNNMIFYTRLAVYSFFAVLILSTSTLAKTYYVDKNHPNAKDSNLGSEGAPWLTIQKAANTVSAGDTVYVQAGTYAERVIINRTSGTEGNLITYQGVGSPTTQGFQISENYIEIDGFTITRQSACGGGAGNPGIYLDADNNVIENNYFYECYSNGIWVTKNADNNTIQNNLIQKTGSNGIVVAGDRNTVQYNEIDNIREKATDAACMNRSSDGIQYFGTNHLIRGNYIHGIAFDGTYVIDAHVDCFQTWEDLINFDEGAYNITIEYNYCDLVDGHTIKSNFATAGFMLENASNITIRNNIIRTFQNINSLAGTSNTVTIYNNTFINDLHPYVVAELGIAANSASTWIVKNNILYNQSIAYHFQDNSETAANIGYNLVYGHDGSELNRANEDGPYANDVWEANPKFVDPAKDDFRLQSDSPAIDAGISLTNVMKDFDGNMRPQGSKFDIGAYEYTLESSSTPPSPPKGLRVVESH